MASRPPKGAELRSGFDDSGAGQLDDWSGNHWSMRWKYWECAEEKLPRFLS